jgi:hypothetical protein
MALGLGTPLPTTKARHARPGDSTPTALWALGGGSPANYAGPLQSREISAQVSVPLTGCSRSHAVRQRLRIGRTCSRTSLEDTDGH